MNAGPSRREIAAALQGSVELLECVGGRHALAAQLLRERVAEMAAARQAHRDKAIVALREAFFPRFSVYAAAPLIAGALARYAASAWRHERSLPQSPEASRGKLAEALFTIMRLNDDKPVSAATARRALGAAEAAQNRTVEMSGRSRLQCGQQTGTPKMLAYADDIAILTGTADFKAKKARFVEDEIAARRIHLAAIERLDAEATKAYGRQEKRREAAIAKVRAAERELKTVTSEALAVQHAIGQERDAYQRERAEHETALLDFDQCLITEFERACIDELERVRKAGQTSQTLARNERTGRVERSVISNSKSLLARLYAVGASMRLATELRLIADPRELPARIAEMKTSWPTIEDLGTGETAS